MGVDPKELQRAGLVEKRDGSFSRPVSHHWDDSEIAILRAAYSDCDRPVDLNVLARSFGRTYASIALKASELHLANRKRRKSNEAITKSATSLRKKWSELTPEERSSKTSQLIKDGSFWEGRHHTAETKRICSENSKDWLLQNQHPKGMLGKHHSEKTKGKLSTALSGRIVPREQVERMLKTTMEKRNEPGFNIRKRGLWKSGWLTIGGQKHYFRSNWEVRYAQMLELLKKGNVISGWEYEAQTFWFPVSKGKNNYTPDFRVTLPNGNVEFHEVKGWMDKRSRTVISRMRKFHPEITLIVRASEFFKRNRILSSAPIPWETK